jgi:hypothetical protein
MFIPDSPSSEAEKIVHAQYDYGVQNLSRNLIITIING